jgi:hypothetical protein
VNAPSLAPTPLPTTSNPDKERLYLLDPAYRSGLRSFQETPSDPAALHRRALALLRPDAFYFRKAHQIVAFLRRHDLVPIAWQPVRLSWHQVLDLWRYQLTKATDDRLALGCELLTCEPSVLLLLADTRGAADIPASVRLWSLKGAFGAVSRSRGNLRDALAVRHRMFGFVHTADEPIDLVRELGVLLPHQRRLMLWRRAHRNADTSPDLTRFIDRRYDALPAVEWMSATEALARFRSLSTKRERHEAYFRRFASRLEDHLRGHGPRRSLTFGAFHPVLRRLRGDGAKLERWLVYMIAAQSLELDRDGVAPILSSGRAELAVKEWTARCAQRR